MKASADEQELLPVKELQLHLELVTVHVAIEHQLIRGRSLEGEFRFPVLIVVLCEGEGSLLDIDGSAIRVEGIVHLLERHARRNVKDGAPPETTVCNQG